MQAAVAAARLPALKADAPPAPAPAPVGAELLSQVRLCLWIRPNTALPWCLPHGLQRLLLSGMPAALPTPLLQLLADPDAEPAQPVKVVPVQRYLAALKEDKRAKESAAARQALLARLQAAVQGTALSSAYRQATGLPTLAEGEMQPQMVEAGAKEVAAELSAGLPTVATLTLQGPIYLGTGPSTPFNPLAAGDPQQVGLQQRPAGVLRARVAAVSVWGRGSLQPKHALVCMCHEFQGHPTARSLHYCPALPPRRRWPAWT